MPLTTLTPKTYGAESLICLNPALDNLLGNCQWTYCMRRSSGKTVDVIACTKWLLQYVARNVALVCFTAWNTS